MFRPVNNSFLLYPSLIQMYQAKCRQSFQPILLLANFIQNLHSTSDRQHISTGSMVCVFTCKVCFHTVSVIMTMYSCRGRDCTSSILQLKHLTVHSHICTLKVPDPIYYNGNFYSNDALSPKISWFQISFKSVKPLRHNKRLRILQLPIPYCVV